MLKDWVQDYVNQGYVRAERHPTLPLTIYNYTPKCSHERVWNNVTVRCRGLVIDDDGEVQALPVPKFFNYNEPEAAQAPWSEQTFDLEEKLDGSLIIAFNYRGQYVFATRGSFTSPQAKKAEELLFNAYGEMSPGLTYIFEVLYPEDQKVVRYEEEELVLITRIETATGKELRHKSEVFRMPQRLQGIKLSDPNRVMQQLEDLTGVKGFVARFENGGRVKFKTPWYVERHRFLQKLSPRFIWEQMKAGTLADMEECLPEHQRKWAAGVALDVASKWATALSTGLTAANAAAEQTKTRKGQAKFIMKHYPEVSKIAFNILDGKVDEAIESAWRKAKPCGVQ